MMTGGRKRKKAVIVFNIWIPCTKRVSDNNKKGRKEIEKRLCPDEKDY